MSTKEGQSILLVKAKGTNISSSIIFNVAKEAEANTLIEKMMRKTYECSELTNYGYKNSLKITSSTTAVFNVNDSNLDYKVNCEIVINENTKTIKFTKFTPVGLDYDQYTGSYLPVIKTDCEYNITDESSFDINLLLINPRDGFVSDYITESETITTYHFISK